MRARRLDGSPLRAGDVLSLSVSPGGPRSSAAGRRVRVTGREVDLPAGGGLLVEVESADAGGPLPLAGDGGRLLVRPWALAVVR